MTKPVTIPNTFATATTAIPLSQLDSDFSTVATALNDANTYSNYAADTGVANAYVVTLTGVSTTYSAGLRIQFKAGNANTGASTLNVNGGGTKNITFQDASALSSGTIAANAIVDVMYDGTQFLLMNDPAGTVGTGDVVGPASATANAVVRFDSTTGKLVKNSVVTIADSTGDMSGVGAFTATGNVTLGDATTDTITLTGTVQPGVVISGSSSGDALRITQTGAGNALLVEDSANPDSSPFVVTAAGDVGIGTSSPAAPLTVQGSAGGLGINIIGRSTGQNEAWLFWYKNGGSTLNAGINGDNQGLKFGIGSSNTEAMRIDTSGNLGIGVTPSAWSSGYKAIEFGSGSIYGRANATDIYLASNSYLGASTFIYKYTGAASYYAQAQGGHYWFNAPSGTENTAITFTQAMTLDASGNLGVGNTNPSAPVDIQANSGGTGIRIRGRASANAGALRFFANDNTTQRARFESNDTSFEINSIANLPITISTNDTERARITSGGVLDLATGAGAVGQIQFPATQVASSNANTLDDYEEGSWTCTMVGSGGGSVSLGTGYYVKVGQVVYCYFDAFSVSTSGLSGNISFQGLPFTSHASVSQSSYMFPTGANNTPCVFYVEQNQTNVTLYKAASGSASVSSFTVSDFVTSTPSMRHSFVYRTNS